MKRRRLTDEDCRLAELLPRHGLPVLADRRDAMPPPVRVGVRHRLAHWLGLNLVRGETLPDGWVVYVCTCGQRSAASAPVYPL